MNRLLSSILVSTLTMYLALPVAKAELSGQQIATQGNNKGAIACMTCHGPEGQGNAAAGYPYLAGLPSTYLQHQLDAFAQGKRTNPIMKPFATALTDSQRKAVADYYAKLPLSGKPAEKTETDTQTLETGRSLFATGKWKDGVPACIQCHGSNGQGFPPHFPAISGQPYTYLKNQLQSWKNGQRSNDPQGLMQAVVSKLSDQEIEAVAHYLASIAPAMPQK